MKCIDRSHPKFFSLLADIVEVMKNKGIEISDEEAFMNTVEAIEHEHDGVKLRFFDGIEAAKQNNAEQSKITITLRGQTNERN